MVKLPLADINLWILFKSVTGEKRSRKKFLENLAVELAQRYKQRKKRKTDDQSCPSL